MIKLHPKKELLSSFVAGELPASLSVIVSSHVELCTCCQSKVQALTEQAAKQCFLADDVQPESIDLDNSRFEESELDEFDLAMFESIIDEAPILSDKQLNTTAPEMVEVAGVAFPVPRALRAIERKPFQGMGKLSRSRVALEDGALRTSLLHIEKGGSVPTHTHKGFEVTLLLQGSFEDEMGTYHTGDFIWLDGEHTHQPVTKTGCVCLTVSNDAIHFTQGMSKLLNPIGQFIY